MAPPLPTSKTHPRTHRQRYLFLLSLVCRCQILLYRPHEIMSYSSSDFRRNPNFLINTGPGGGMRHMLDLNLAAHAANHARGPGYSDATMMETRSVLNSRGNFHGYNSHSANHWERSTANDLIDAHKSGSTMEFTPRECAHLRGGVQFLRDNRNSLPRGMVKQMVDMYSLARD